MNLTITESLSVMTVLLQGILSFFSPCVLPLLPLYIGYLSGGTGEGSFDNGVVFSRKTTVINTLCFVAGVGFSFFLLGLGMRTVGRFFAGKELLFARAGGIIVILFGLYQLGVFGRPAFLMKEKRLPVSFDKMAMSPVTALIMGFVFSFAWTPCVGPTLSGVLLMAASETESLAGFLLIGVYTLGFSIPFLLTGIFTTAVLNFFSSHRNIVRHTVKLSGILLIFMGILMITGRMNGITGYLSQILPATESTAEITAENTSEAAAGSVESTAEITAENASEAAAGSVESTAEITAENASEAAAGSVESTAEITAENASEAADENTEGTEEELTEEEESTEDPAYGEEEELPEDEDESGEETDLFPAPDFTLKDQYGATHSLSDYRGKVVFLNFWATWCPPCRAEMPDIQAIYEETKDSRDPEPVILGVAFPGSGRETDEEGIREFMEENGYTYPVLMDTERSLELPYYVMSYPTTYMIDRNGAIVGALTGMMTKDLMQEAIRQTQEAQ